MHFPLFLILVVLMAGCASTYKQSLLNEPSAKLVKGRSIVIATPSNGWYEKKEYAASGKMTMLATKAAFARFSSSITISDDCRDLTYLKNNGLNSFDYYVVPEILHWEDRATEWSGISDKIEVKISVYEGQGWKELVSTLISGKSKWMTLGGDHPQDLLPEPLNQLVESLY
jgi:hypothetical protein